MAYQITVTDCYDNQIALTACEGESLFSVLGRHQPPIFKGNCGGRGQCERCIVFIEEAQEYVKACRQTADRDMHLKLPFPFQEVREPVLLARKVSEDVLPHAVHEDTDESKRIALETRQRYGVAIDLGTTSIGMRLLECDGGKVFCEHCMYNPQAVCGADVISRIAYARDAAHAHILQRLVWQQIAGGIRQMAEAVGIKVAQITDISVAGNTTMLHLLMGYDVSGLGSYPFTSEHLGAVRQKASGLSHCMLHIYPGIAPFVGADIVSGAVSLGLGQKETYDLLIDLGTNGELLLINANHGFCGAAACGSAFDGYVTADIPKTEGSSVGGSSYGLQRPGGYGTDIINRMMLLRQRGIIRADGLLMERYAKDGYRFPDGMTVTQEHIREVQKAKAAIRTGIELILMEAGISFSDCQVYVAGNFGFHLDISAAVRAGMFPSGGRIAVAGNTSLKGAELLLSEEAGALDAAERLARRTRVLEFANMSSFSERYIGYLDFL